MTAANLAKPQKLAGIRKEAHEAVKKADRFGFAPRRDPECGNAQQFLETGGAMSGDLESSLQCVVVPLRAGFAPTAGQCASGARGPAGAVADGADAGGGQPGD